MTPEEIILAVQALTALLAQALQLANTISAAHTGAPGVSAAQVSASASAAAASLAKLSKDLGG